MAKKIQFPPMININYADLVIGFRGDKAIVIKDRYQPLPGGGGSQVEYNISLDEALDRIKQNATR
jgi:hypothetical protein